MTPHPPTRPRPARSGITLTEVLISILIMGVGMISLATLFPLGLLRVREAQRNGRSTLLAKSAFGEVEGRGLLFKPTFLMGGLAPLQNGWYVGTLAGNPFVYDPWAQDYSINLGWGVGPNNPNVAQTYGAGRPVMYDPLWWSVTQQTTGLTPFSTVPASTVALADAARFGQGNFVGDIRPDNVGGSVASAYGLQRVTNFLPIDPVNSFNTPVNWPFTFPVRGAATADVAAGVFVSPDNPVLLNEGLTGDSSEGISGSIASRRGSLGVGSEPSATSGSPLLPDLHLGSMMNDWAYSWAFTGQQADVTEGTIFDGSVVVFNNRAIGFEAAGAGLGYRAVGERTVEAIFGYNSVCDLSLGGGTAGFGTGDDRIVLLRWPTTEPDPSVTVGNWIADVTYEFDPVQLTTKFGPQPYPGQRCYWYQVAKVGEAEPDTTGDVTPTQFRRMVVTLSSPVRARTAIQPGGMPVYTNVALLNPWVVNVFPKVFGVR